MAWLRGLKTTYYLRALGATSAEKSTINTGALNAVKPATVEAAAPAAAPAVEAKSLKQLKKTALLKQLRFLWLVQSTTQIAKLANNIQ